MKTFMMNREKFVQLFDQIHKFYQQAWNQESREVFEKYSKFYLQGTKLMTLFYIVVVVLAFLNPFFVMLIVGELITPFGFTLPWIDESTFYGYLINYINQLFQAFFVYFIYSTSHGLQFVITINVFCVYDILCLMLDDLNKDLIDETKKNSPNIRKQLVKIIELHQDLLRFFSTELLICSFNPQNFSYISIMQNVFKENLLVFVFCTTVQAGCCLFAVVVSKWLVGLVLFLTLSFQIFIVCAFGEALSIKV